MKIIIFKLSLENIKISKWKKLIFQPTTTKKRISRNWNIEEGFMEIDNSKDLARKLMR